MTNHPHQFPKLHNAAWPGVVGKGGEGNDPPIELDTMLDLTAAAEVDGRKFDGVDLFLFDPHVSIDATDKELEDLADRVRARGLVIGSVVAPVWEPTGGGSAAGDDEQVHAFLTQVRKGCTIAKKLRELGVRPYGVVRLDTATSVADWAKDPEGNQSKIADTLKAACDIAEEYDERLAAEGEICWGGMQSWRTMVDLLKRVGHPERFGFQADMAHTLLYLLGYNAPDDAILPTDFDWSDNEKKKAALKELTHALREWTIDFHVAQNDATVHGTGTHDKTGRHCLPNDPNGKLNIAEDAGFWLRDEHGDVLKTCRHICWDGCMFPNEVMHKPETWNSILSAMLSVQDAHGWNE
ncbi:sugar phosphate isomerase/epimerase [Rubripirellula amarantea]|uniref:Xylose isomerase-like TIM barrel n=1 Tax=Rubripirellula amarantea TaxID=2527999 RepID=A0A5C5WRA8_9BACT|nr:TIM barrel protein [Rubripirellula amarantea]MDA8745753.1 sugar phosphate isomerase/epimerase [Rubripirellula amarantea]TWT53434.1 Xylose isomerase-like TIM barrel [Rubripirellula amarantea]